MDKQKLINELREIGNLLPNLREVEPQPEAVPRAAKSSVLENFKMTEQAPVAAPQRFTDRVATLEARFDQFEKMVGQLIEAAYRQNAVVQNIVQYNIGDNRGQTNDFDN